MSGVAKEAVAGGPVRLRDLAQGPLQALAALGLAWFALALAWKGPAAAAYAAGCLVAALALDAGSRVVLGWTTRRSDAGALAIRRPPSLVLPLGDLPRLAAIGLGLALSPPEAVPVVAGAGAGIVAIGALARLAMARVLFVAARENEER